MKHLLNTHLHLDHIFGNPFLLKEYRIKGRSKPSRRILAERSTEAQARMFGFQLPEAPVPLGKYML
ncbi:MAG: MBL fold metallo-hydrolase [Phocaeicola vulgatus]